ncbi:alpha/beta fold hydrolase [Amycolatopsis albispora]|uniref:Alpha/beta hydrolase n=1 Tax=Amycolatopsis albispora TaxID=1804986 RepID=A0A344LAZ3_9PSEU|nr:alpha/beta hydrolase [Amycolatopsis albispora]AXB45217.1 alpha/beta hydrolase [Amycolatopsis albispora]
MELTERFESSAGQVRWASFGDGPPLVLLHGTPWSSFVWRRFAEVLAGWWRVYLWDMPGYGQSAKFDGQDVSLAAQARVFSELLDHWGLDRPAVVAHDFGGAVSLRAHLLHGRAYERLAVVDPVALAPWGSPFFRLVRENAAVFEELPPFLHEALVREYINSASSPGLHADVLTKLTEPWLGEVGQAAFYRQIAQADQRYTDEVQPRYPEIDLPFLVCWGVDDQWIPVAKASELAGLVPGAGLRLIQGAGHLVQEDNPAALLGALLPFLRGE